jgi:hypothetical protein
MQVALPHSPQSLAIPLVTLLLGAAGGATVAAIVADDDGVQSPATPAAVQQSFESRPQEGVAVQSINRGPQTSGLSEKSTDPSISQSLRSNSSNVGRPVEGAAAQAMAKDANAATALSEKGTDPSVQPSDNSSTFGSRP